MNNINKQPTATPNNDKYRTVGHYILPMIQTPKTQYPVPLDYIDITKNITWLDYINSNNLGAYSWDDKNGLLHIGPYVSIDDTYIDDIIEHKIYYFVEDNESLLDMIPK